MFLTTSDIMTELGQFFVNMFEDLKSGLLFFGGPLDILVAVLDIFATSLVIYYILKLLRDSRAWQLLKGVILIIGFAIICSLVGLTTVGFLFNNTISILAIAFVVIFQPELRRALETVGRNSFHVISTAISQDEPSRSAGSVHNLIESIVRACEKLSETRTGALIIIERQSRLGELVEQENVVQLDAAVSATMLIQVFYKGSPLHDGAVLIRDGRLTAARVHVPLSDNYHLRKDYGTRHRAAIGASEMGDAIAVVVSEERGSICLAHDGRLYTLDNGDALRTLLHKLLGVTSRPGVSFSSLSSMFRSSIRQTRRKKGAAEEEAATFDEKTDENVAANPSQQPKKRAASRISRSQRIILMVASLAIAIGLWLYVQVTVNPVNTRAFEVPLTVENQELIAATYDLQIPATNIQITLQGRKKLIEGLTAADITAYIDCSAIDSVGTIELAVKIDTGSLMSIQATAIAPIKVSVVVTEKSNP